MYIVDFRAGKKGRPYAFVEGKVSFPVKFARQPQAGERWQVYVAGAGRDVNYLELVRKVDLQIPRTNMAHAMRRAGIV